ncbi:MAG: DEAD/DEAH box helicase [Bacteroidia bacterium]|nr:DEAD/DEAH box helicase [Bacteroidia bacterium]
MKFEDYSIVPEIKKSLAESGFKRPTDIQFKSIPSILKGEDVLAIAQTGTGKTAAFAIPLLSMLHKENERGMVDFVRCLVLVPTRELALQISEVFRQIGKYSNVRIFCLHGGVEQEEQIDTLIDGTDVLVATPGRLFDLISQRIFHLKKLEVLVLDEADRMLDNRFIHDIRDLQKHLPKHRQTLFFSATIDNRIKKLAYNLVNNNAIRIQISPKDPVSKNVHHSVAFIEMDDKRFFLESLIRDNEDRKILVFVRTKVRAERVNSAMERAGILCETLHGDKEQKERFRALENFRKGINKVLIATDVSARGIDVEGVDMVVNYDLPDVPENYVHRIGRTGRGRSKGQAISFCSTEEKPLLEEIEKLVTKQIEIVSISKADYEFTLKNSESAAPDLAALLREAEELEEQLRKKRKKKK